MSRDHPTLPHQTTPAGLPTKESSTSFWHTEPSPLLLGHRSTRNLPEKADIVVIGSGITGASIAHHLLTTNDPNNNDPSSNGNRTRGPNVLMLEAREACWGATGRNGGHCQPLLIENPHDPSIGHFELKNFRTLQDLIKEKEIDCEFVEQPGVRGIYSLHHLREAEESLKVMETTAPELGGFMRIVTEKAELRRLRIPTADGAVVTEIAARLWPYKFVARILEDLLTSTTLSGTFNLQTLTPALSLTPAQNGPARSWTITTPRGDISAQKVILATNAYTSHLLPDSFTNLILPCRGQMSALQPLPSLTGSSRLQTSFGFLGDGLDDYLIQRPSERGGHLMFGGGRQHGPSISETDDGVVDPQTARYLRTRLVGAFGLPEGKAGGEKREDEGGEGEGEGEGEREKVQFTAANEWSGIMGFSRDERPWVGAVPGEEGVFVSAGYTGHGMPNSWLCGKAVAMMALAGREGEGGESAGRGRGVEEEGEEDGEVMQKVMRETGLPRSYILTKERMERAEMRGGGG
ncbi:hypothetical protein LTR78_003044 [Recurvomyces mirabilis]|uniref:FAD dependent oxidoreductase domain-containing protein n=1 Tax=Recurvomyces mirabilis TaxID=574656 RepID=A0AAE0WSJ6_9PEZI|nr:hypothetical protein LTR78_003044 [Recurvomyces mirabilis]